MARLEALKSQLAQVTQFVGLSGSFGWGGGIILWDLVPQENPIGNMPNETGGDPQSVGQGTLDTRHPSVDTRTPGSGPYS